MGAVSRNNRIERLAPCRCLDGLSMALVDSNSIPDALHWDGDDLMAQ